MASTNGTVEAEIDQLLTAALIEEVFRKHDGRFGMKPIPSTATVRWPFLSQALLIGKMAAKEQSPASSRTRGCFHRPIAF